MLLEKQREREVKEELENFSNPNEKRAVKFGLDVQRWAENSLEWAKPLTKENVAHNFDTVEYLLLELEKLKLAAKTEVDKYRVANSSPLGWGVVKHLEDPDTQFATLSIEELRATEKQLVGREKDLQKVVKGASLFSNFRGGFGGRGRGFQRERGGRRRGGAMGGASGSGHQAEQKAPKAPKSGCFNCGGQHYASNCAKPPARGGFSTKRKADN